MKDKNFNQRNSFCLKFFAVGEFSAGETSEECGRMCEML